MCKILLPIKPKYVDEIIKGNKTFEFRKNIPKRKVDKVVIYCSSPVMKIIGEFEVKQIHSGSPKEIWNLTVGKRGINKKEYNVYYNEKNKAYAYEIDNLYVYEQEKNLIDFNIKSAPQSFMYLD